LFQAFSVHHAHFFEDVIRKLREKGAHISFQVLDHPHYCGSEKKALRNFAAERLGIPSGRIYNYPGSPQHSVDLLVCADVYARFPQNVRQTCLMFHGPVLERRNFAPHVFRKTLYDFNKVIANGEYDLRLIEKHRDKDRNGFHVVVGGCPFLDKLANPAASRKVYFQRLGLDPDRPTVLLAPNWSWLVQCSTAGMGYMEDIISALSDLRINLIVKLHACSYNPIMARGVNWRYKLEDLKSKGAIHVDMNVDDRDALVHSDILVTDSSSRAFNFMMLKKPIIQFHPITKPLDEFEIAREDMLRRGALVAETPGQIPNLIWQILKNGWRLQDAQKIASDCIAHFGSATNFVAEQMITWAGDC